MNLTKNILPYIIIIVLTILLVKQCDKKPETVYEYIHTTDTVTFYDTIPGETDTIRLPGKTEKEIVYVYVNDSTKLFLDTTTDKKVSIFTSALIQGKIYEWNLSYRLFVPDTIVKTKIITNTDTKIIHKQKRYIDIEPAYDIFSAKPSIGASILQEKEKFMYGYGIELGEKTFKVKGHIAF